MSNPNQCIQRFWPGRQASPGCYKAWRGCWDQVSCYSQTHWTLIQTHWWRGAASRHGHHAANVPVKPEYVWQNLPLKGKISSYRVQNTIKRWPGWSTYTPFMEPQKRMGIHRCCCPGMFCSALLETLSLVFLPLWSKNLSLDFQVGVGEEQIFVKICDF